MHWIFRALTDRLKALFVADVALDLETQFMARQADRKAELLRQTVQFEQEGLETVACDLREKAESITTERPLATVLPAIAELGKSFNRLDTTVSETTINNGSHRRPAQIPAKRKTASTSRRK